MTRPVGLGGRTVDEVRGMVYEYERLPHGEKAQWRQARGVAQSTMNRWRDAVFEGDLDRGLVPRKSGGMASSSERRLVARYQAAHEAEVARLEERVRELQSVNDMLGKAIGLLHEMNAHEPVAPPTPPDPSDS